MSEELLDYFGLYREKIAQLKKLTEERDLIIEYAGSLDKQRQELSSEINQIQNIITHCIDTGMGPTEVKLKTDKETRGNIWSRF